MREPSIEIRILTASDAAAFWHLRLEGLEREAAAFGASADEHRSCSVGETVARIEPSDDQFVVGAFADGVLRGVVGFARDHGAKRRHRGVVWGVYVGPELRGKGVAQRLLETLIQRAREIAGLERLVLAANAADPKATGLYRRVGFVPFGCEPHALKIGDSYVDDEHMTLDLTVIGGETQ